MSKRAAGAIVVLSLLTPFISLAEICPSVSLGSSGASVSAVQKVLYNTYSNFPSPTGYFGTLTQAALKQWQSDHGIQQTGTVGPKTAAAMNLCTSAPATPITSSAPTADRTLFRGLSGQDVTALQLFLISQKLLSLNSATGYFGVLTEAAVQKYQYSQGIVSSGTPDTTGYGTVGPKTRAAMAALTGTISIPQITPSAPTNTTLPAASSTPTSPTPILIPTPAPTPALTPRPSPGTVTPEQFGALHDGVHNDAPAINAAVNTLASTGGGTVQLACNVTYNLSDPTLAPFADRSMKVEIIPKSGVNIKGCGASTILRVANNVNQPPIKYPTQLFGAMVTPIYTTAALSNVTFSNFTIDMNGANNSCDGACFTWSAVLGADTANNVTVDNVTFLNNPGSNDIEFGGNPALSSKITINNSHFSNGGYAINHAAFDYSAVWLSARDSAVTNNTFEHGSPPGNPFGSGAAIELHGSNIIASGNVISDYWSGANIANLSGASDGLKFNSNTLNNVSAGVIVWVQSVGSRQDNVEVSNNSINLNTADPKFGIDLAQQAAYPGGTITISNNTITVPAQNSGTADRCGINIGQFSSVTVTGNTISNSPGPAICGKSILANSAIYINDNTIKNPGVNASAQYKSGIWMPTSTNIPNWLAIKNNSISGNSTYGIWGALNVASGDISGNTITGAGTQMQWTGSGTNLGALNSDAQRKQDLQTLSTALNSYYQKHGTYKVTGAGAGGSGGGTVSSDGPPTYQSVVQGLYADGDLSSNANLPALSNEYYLLYTCDAGQTYALSAKLDNPTADDISYIQTTCNGTGVNGTYTLYKRNYALQGTTPNIQQFGFYNSDDSGQGDFTSAISSFTNMVWIQSATWPNATIINEITKAKNLHMGVVLETEWMFFTEPNTGATFQLNSFSQFDTLWSQIQQTGLASSIKALYLFDEPFDRFMDTGTTCAANTPCASATTLLSNLNSVIAHVHSVAPGIPTMAIYNSPGSDHPAKLVQLNNLTTWVPQGIDFVGFDCYYSTRGPGCTGYISQALSTLAAARPSQKFFLVPDAWWCTDTANCIQPPNDSTLATQLQSFINFAQTYKQIIGAYSFIWETVPGASARGLDSGAFPQTLAALQKWFKEIRQAGGVPTL